MLYPRVKQFISEGETLEIMIDTTILNDAKQIFDYLYVKDDKDISADLIIGFGHFDLRIPRRCAELYQKGLAKKILFTGGRGAGSADLKEAEAIAFCKTLRSEYPEISSGDIIVESESTNTGENILMSNTALKKRNNGFCFENGISSVIAVASPYRQRRVWRTLQKHLPRIKLYNRPPETKYEKETALFRKKGENFIQLLIGEVERIRDYPDKGYMACERMPQIVLVAYKRLKRWYELG